MASLARVGRGVAAPAFRCRRFASAPQPAAPAKAVQPAPPAAKAQVSSKPSTTASSPAKPQSKKAGFGTAMALSVTGMVGGGAWMWYESEEANKARVQGMPLLSPVPKLAAASLTGQWHEVGGVLPGWQRAWVGTQWGIAGGEDGSLAVTASAHLRSVLIPRVAVPVGTLQPAGGGTAGPFTSSLAALTPWADALRPVLGGDLLVLAAGSEDGTSLSPSAAPHWILVVNGEDRRRAWLLSRTPFLRPDVKLAAVATLEGAAVDTTGWRDTTPALSWYHAPCPPSSPLPVLDPLDSDEVVEAEEAAARAASTPVSVGDMVRGAARGAREAVRAGLASADEVAAGGGGVEFGVRSPLQMAAHSLAEVRAQRAADELARRKSAVQADVAQE